jgi:hypothetical protein
MTGNSSWLSALKQHRDMGNKNDIDFEDFRRILAAKWVGTKAWFDGTKQKPQMQIDINLSDREIPGTHHFTKVFSTLFSHCLCY